MILFSFDATMERMESMHKESKPDRKLLSSERPNP